MPKIGRDFRFLTQSGYCNPALDQRGLAPGSRKYHCLERHSTLINAALFI
jgi:hypothetical protein